MTKTTDPKVIETTKRKPAKLFHAVVLAGAALVNCPGIPADQALSEVNAAAEAPAIASKPCPAGSERPYPPCYWIN